MPRKIWALPDVSELTSEQREFLLTLDLSPERTSYEKLLRSVSQTLELPIEDLIYLAAIVDGEGCIGVFTREHMKKWMRPHLQIVNTDFNLQNWLKSRLNLGSFTLNNNPGPNRKSTWNYRAACDDAILIIRSIFPYLIIKKKQAEILLSLDLFEKSFVRQPCESLPKEIEEMRNECFDAIRKLNWRARYAVN